MRKEIRECQECEAVLTEGYEFEESAFCPSCAKEMGVAKVSPWRIWCEWDCITNTSNSPEIHKVYRLHDNIYFSKATAELFEDGKDYISTEYMVVLPDEEWYEGAQADNYYTADSYEQAEELAEDLA